MRMTLVLANYTGWTLSEIEDLPVDLFVEWFLLIPKNR